MAKNNTVVRLSGIAVRHGPVVALEGFDLTVLAGERVGLIGPSGAGKTTVLNVIVGSVVPDTGSREVLGADLASLAGRALRRHRAEVGLISQQLDLSLPLRVVHNVNAGRLGGWSTIGSLWSLVRPAGRIEVARSLDRVGLAERIDSRTDELSGGERQRVAVARVLMQRPRLILADEPTSSVDPHWSESVMSSLSGGDPVGDSTGDVAADEPVSTSIISAHDPDLIRRHVDRLIGMRAGRLVFDLPAAEVDDRLVGELYDEQPAIP